ncbi:hypothetical protein FOQG_17245 [Fusarium oxysporum f. sp. raphani 54005]|uniref:Uncharacterized protein n=1 Tax=Fusarium oxysporum f. sp. raphani 54005 TaxID=1089458 RepID=X0BHV8_FUSOX|nr:hypothetical protein FOQG_17245 [Fusarium oxysporum f. sp. raphani 54005]
MALIRSIAETLTLDNDTTELSPELCSPQSRSSSRTDPSLAGTRVSTDTSNPSGQAPSYQTHSLSPQLVSLHGASARPRPVVPRAYSPAFTTNEAEMGYLMGYMEYVFPIMFPFYKPTILEGGRTWLMVLAMKNVGFSKSITSLSSYFFSVIPVISGSAHNACFTKTWQELCHQTNTALASVQQDLLQIRFQGIDTNLQDSVHLLANIVQLLAVERELFTSSEWKVHLKAAVGLLGQIVLHYGVNIRGECPNAGTVIEKLADPIASPDLAATPLKAEQAAFRFFSAFLVGTDVIASTCLEEPSELQQYLSEEVLGNQDQRYVLSLETVTGCQDWVFRLIGDISAFNTWKKIKKRTGELAIEEVHSRMRNIDQRWQKHTDHLGQQCSRHQQGIDTISGIYGPLESVLRDTYYSQTHQLSSSDMHVRVTQIWAYAVRTYLLVTTFGWQPRHPDILSNIRHTVSLLNDVTSPSWLRSLIWPICVTGCIAVDDHRPIIRSILERAAALQTLGSLRRASSIIERVWAQQVCDVSNWDYAQCFNVLGYAVLLV